MNPSSFFKEINSWQDFVGATDRLDKKGKGDAFELLTKYFFLLNPRYSFYDNVWLWKDVPQKVLDDIGLPRYSSVSVLIFKNSPLSSCASL